MSRRVIFASAMLLVSLAAFARVAVSDRDEQRASRPPAREPVASENPQGRKPRQARRLVRAFEREGFTWGGRWPTAPDGMHFELHSDARR